MTTRYEVTDLFEAGKSGNLIQTPKPCGLDDLGGVIGPVREGLEDE
jgi:hypothetical protein